MHISLARWIEIQINQAIRTKESYDAKQKALTCSHRYGCMYICDYIYLFIYLAQITKCFDLQMMCMCIFIIVPSVVIYTLLQIIVYIQGLSLHDGTRVDHLVTNAHSLVWMSGITSHQRGHLKILAAEFGAGGEKNILARSASEVFLNKLPIHLTLFTSLILIICYYTLPTSPFDFFSFQIISTSSE